jgi:hypothetical protein
MAFRVLGARMRRLRIAEMNGVSQPYMTCRWRTRNRGRPCIANRMKANDSNDQPNRLLADENIDGRKDFMVRRTRKSVLSERLGS